MPPSEDAPYRLVLTRTAARALGERVPEAVSAAVIEFLLGDLLQHPRRVGRPLQRELVGLSSARRGTYRVLYEIDDEHRAVRVIEIDHRGDVHRRR